MSAKPCNTDKGIHGVTGNKVRGTGTGYDSQLRGRRVTIYEVRGIRGTGYGSTAAVRSRLRVTVTGPLSGRRDFRGYGHAFGKARLSGLRARLRIGATFGVTGTLSDRRDFRGYGYRQETDQSRRDGLITC